MFAFEKSKKKITTRGKLSDRGSLRDFLPSIPLTRVDLGSLGSFELCLPFGIDKLMGFAFTNGPFLPS